MILVRNLPESPSINTTGFPSATARLHAGPGVSPAEESALPYTTGLEGVSIAVDTASSRSLWTSMAFLFLLIFFVRLAQRGNAHLRHLTSLGKTSLEQQRYWSHNQGSFWPSLKKNLLYAPLRKKRHNREIQLSAAINAGTIPSRLHTVLLSLYFFSNVAYCLMLDYHNKNKAAVTAELRGRTGHLAVVNMVGLFLFAGRNNPLIGILRVSFDTFNLFHRWIGRIVILESIAHTIAWLVNKHSAVGFEGINYALRKDPFSQWGLVGMIAMLVILLQSPSAIRHAFYETFLHLHQLLALLALLGVFYHIKIARLPQMSFVVIIITIWCYDRLFRWSRIIYRNLSFRHGFSDVMVEALPEGACRVTFDIHRPWTHRPGCHAYVYLPTISLWQSHPFSIAWSETRPVSSRATDSEKGSPWTTIDLEGSSKSSKIRTSTSVSFVISKRTGMTASLYKRASKVRGGIIYLKGFVEGPYGGLESLHSYGTVLLFAGGVGITHQLGHVRDLLEGYASGTVAVRRIVLVWTVRFSEQLEWVKPWMDVILAMPGRRDVLQVELFVTKPRSNKDIRSVSGTVQMRGGRVKPSLIVEREFERRVGAMVVGVCGPGALADDVRAAAREVVETGRVDFWEEGFTW